MEVRLKNAYIIHCEGYDLDERGEVACIHCSYIPETKSGQSQAGRKVKATIHYLEANHCLKAEVRLYDRLLTVADVSEEKERDFIELLNPDSLTTISEALVDPVAAQARPYDHFQFIRVGYFTLDPDATPDRLIFNRTVSLKDAWSKMAQKVRT
jgi:glutaminyl-tRNA synthetase